MVENLAHQKQAVSEAVAEKVAVLRTLLPPAVAEAVDEGDRDAGGDRSSTAPWR